MFGSSKTSDADGLGGAFANDGGTGAVKLPVPTTRLRRWNVGMCLFHLIFAIITFSIGQIDLRLPVYRAEMGLKVLNGSKRGWKYVPLEPVRVGWIHATVAVAWFFLLSSLAHFGNAVLWRKYYERALENAYAPFRWIEYSFSASVMVLILAYIPGNVFQRELVALFGLTFITMVFGHLHEVICRPKSLQEWAEPNVLWRLQAHIFGYVPQLFAWGLIIAQFMRAATASTTDSQGETREMPKFVYGIVFGEVIVFMCFGIVQLVVSLRAPAKYYQGEIAYMWLSLFAKGFLGVMMLANVLMAGGYSEIYDDEE